MKKMMNFLKSSYLIVIGIAIGATILTVGALSIPTNIDNAIQTIKTIYISSDGVSTGTNAMVVIDNTTGAALTVRGNMNIGEKFNSVSGSYSTVGGGMGNYLTGDYSIIAGGNSNRVSGNYSFAAGKNAEALYDATFVWADNLGGPFQSWTGRSFLIRANRGVAIGTSVTLGMNSLRVWNGTTGRVAAKEYCDENGTGCILASALGGGGDTLWTVNGGALYNNTGSLVGINTISPTEALDVNGSLRIRTISGATTANNVLVTNASGKILYIPFSTIMSGNGYRGKNGNDIYNTNTGGVGIGAIPSIGYSLVVTGGDAVINPATFTNFAGGGGGGVGINRPTQIGVSLAVSGNFVAGKIATFHNLNTNCAIVGGYGGDIGSAGNMANAFIGGGFGNTITQGGDNSFIGGGTSNSVYRAENSAIIGGSNNDVVDQIASNTSNTFIGGGDRNQIGGRDNAIIAGTINIIRGAGSYGFIGGGNNNLISGGVSSFFFSNSIIGGANNTIAYANNSFVAGGSGNSVINGSDSFVAGNNAHADHSNVFVRNDGSAAFASTNSNQFLIHATNGVGINTNNPASTLDVNGDSTLSGNVIVKDLLKLKIQDAVVPTCDASSEGSVVYSDYAHKPCYCGGSPLGRKYFFDDSACVFVGGTQ